MASEWEHNHLRQTDEHIRAAKSYIRRQERLIERLAAEGKNIDDAFAVPHLLTGALRLLESHLQFILDRLGQEKYRRSDSQARLQWIDVAHFDF